MRLPFKSRFYGLVGFQLCLLLALIFYKQFTLLAGERILLETIPVDPREMFRGDYVALRYPISRLDRWLWKERSYQKGESVYVTLRRRGRFWDAAAVSKSPAGEGELFIRGRASRVTRDTMRVEYGIESYFVPEGKGLELERRAGRGLIAEIAVDRNGRAVIRSVHREQAVPRQ
jgi:uncharacterized membrane-anchored protein